MLWLDADNRGTSNAFGVPFERGSENQSLSPDDLVRHGEQTWEVHPTLRCIIARTESSQSSSTWCHLA